MRRLVSGLLALSALFTAAAAPAAEFPERPIRFIVPTAAGSTPDIIARVISAELTKQMGQSVVVENRPGANGTLALQAIAQSPADGYTMGYGSAPALTINPAVRPNLPYDTFKDFQMVTQLVFGMNILTVSPQLPVKSVRELIDYAKAHPGKLTYGSSGSGGSEHVSMEMFKLMTGTDMLHVPFNSLPQATAEVIAGRVNLVFDNLASIGPHVKAGRVRALGVTALKRSPAFPDLPTISEAGVPGFEVITWSGVIVPAGVPKPIVARLADEINKALASQAVVEKLGAGGYDLVGGTPEQFTAFVKKEIVKWADVVKRSGTKVD